MRLRIFMFLLVLLINLPSCKKDVSDSHENISTAFPFPNHTSYLGNHIKPTNYSQTELDNQTKVFFNQWKGVYLKNDCNSNEYYVNVKNGVKTVSEAHGYGMMIICFMAESENNAKQYFDGMFNYYKSHPSCINNRLMDWKQLTCNDIPSSDDDAASDGDIDIAFALLLAHKQWGSNGEINYLSEAKNLINAIMKDEINPNTWAVKLGDWCNSTNANFYYGTRSSDFITSHFKVFSTFTNNSNWNLVADECYHLINSIQNTQSPSTGLMPDFIIHTNTTPISAGQNYLEDIYDGDYYYNACRFPLRIGVDYLLTGDGRAKTAINKINNWLIASTNNNVSKISNGYKLDGTAIYNWNDATFIAPFVVGTMTDTTKQSWLNALYEELISNNDLQDGDYYSNTLKLLSLIIISGNYWNPDI